MLDYNPSFCKIDATLFLYDAFGRINVNKWSLIFLTSIWNICIQKKGLCYSSTEFVESYTMLHRTIILSFPIFGYPPALPTQCDVCTLLVFHPTVPQTNRHLRCHEDVWGNGGIPRHYMAVSRKLHAPAALRAPGTHWLEKWVGPRAGLVAVEKESLPLPGNEP
jgi:hypothetical protein